MIFYFWCAIHLCTFRYISIAFAICQHGGIFELTIDSRSRGCLPIEFAEQSDFQTTGNVILKTVCVAEFALFSTLQYYHIHLNIDTKHTLVSPELYRLPKPWKLRHFRRVQLAYVEEKEAYLKYEYFTRSPCALFCYNLLMISWDVIILSIDVYNFAEDTRILVTPRDSLMNNPKLSLLVAI